MELVFVMIHTVEWTALAEGLEIVRTVDRLTVLLDTAIVLQDILAISANLFSV